MEIFLLFLQFFAELLLQIFGEVLIEFVWRSVARLLGFRHAAVPIDSPAKTNPIAAIFGYGLIGGMVGGLTLLVFPASFIVAPILRVINLFFAPVLVGLLMVMLVKQQQSPWLDRRHRHQPTRHQDTTEVYQFSCGFVFAFAIALVRFIWAS